MAGLVLVATIYCTISCPLVVKRTLFFHHTDGNVFGMVLPTGSPMGHTICWFSYPITYWCLVGNGWEWGNDP